MKKYLHIFFQFLTILLVSAAMVACHSHRDDDEPSYWGGELYLNLRVDVLENAASGKTEASRASETYYELPVLDTEKLHTLRIIILKTLNNEVVYNDYNTLYIPGSGIGDLRYKVDFSTPYAIYLFGNEAGLPADILDKIRNLEVGKSYSIGNPLDNIVWESNAQGILIDNTGEDKAVIPMTEKYELTTIARPLSGAENAVFTMERTFFVTRAASKFTFNFYKSEDWNNLATGETKLLTVKGLKFSGLGRDEFVLPTGTTYDPVKSVENTNQYGGRLITAFSLPAGSTSDGEYTFNIPSFRVDNLNVMGNGEPLTFAPELYYPESKGLTGGKFTCAISFDGETYTEAEELPNLSSLPRNTHVVVNIIIYPQTVNLIVIVKDYTLVELDPVFGLYDGGTPPAPPTPEPGDDTGSDS